MADKESSARPDRPANGSKKWLPLSESRFGPFLTRKVFLLPGSVRVIWRSREQRKCYNRLQGKSLRTWWAPTAISWWIGVLFAVGSTAFMLGSVSVYVKWVGVATGNLTFFVGSIFFTSAAFLQYLEVAATAWSPGGGFIGQVSRRNWQPLRLELRRIDWWAVVIQLIGTIFFNVSTYQAMTTGMGSAEADVRVWRPDMCGSVCFLLSSGLAWIEVCHKWIAIKVRQISWWIVALNLSGSVAFGVSAVASYQLTNGTMVSVSLDNAGTFTGALCFLVGGLLLLPERVALLKRSGVEAAGQ
ncbi:hypothetical protein [Microbulbifer sp. HZ11]|uniref:hypothetical protein n=1 Tax=Microbulbifer sp. HZ11 TaxID=1453501 RepID=UPI0012DFB050|nr:hypothetical protein [Microbulbifer sp. HZ11]